MPTCSKLLAHGGVSERFRLGRRGGWKGRGVTEVTCDAVTGILPWKLVEEGSGVLILSHCSVLGIACSSIKMQHGAGQVALLLSREHV